MTIEQCDSLALIAYPAINNDQWTRVVHEDDRYIKVQYNEIAPLFDFKMKVYKKIKVYNDERITAVSIMVFYFKEDDTYKFYHNTRKLEFYQKDDRPRYFVIKEAICFKKHRSPSVLLGKGGYRFASIRRIEAGTRMNLRNLFLYFNPVAINALCTPVPYTDFPVPLASIKKGLTVEQIGERHYRGYPSYESMKDYIDVSYYTEVIQRYYKKEVIEFFDALKSMTPLKSDERCWYNELTYNVNKQHIVSLNDGYNIEPVVYSSWCYYTVPKPINDRTPVKNVVATNRVPSYADDKDLPF